MALIKTDSQNYTNIADAIRGLVGVKTIFDKDITTTTQNSTGVHMVNSLLEYIIDDYAQRIGEVFDITYDSTTYICELKKYKQAFTSGDICNIYYFGNLAFLDFDGGLGYPNTDEPFLIYKMVYNDGNLTNVIFYTSTPGTHHFTIVKIHYKPKEMAKVLDENYPDYGVSYDTLSGNGENPVTGSTYGYKAVGFAENSALTSVNISDRTREIGDYAFAQCTQLSISTLPEGVEIIGEGAFWRCFNITSFTFPKSIKKISGSAFDYCTGLKTVTFNGTPEKISLFAFALISGVTFNVPWAEGEVAGYPWGASNSTINYNYTG